MAPISYSSQDIIGAILIDEFGTLSIRTDTVVFADGVEIARTYHRQAVTAAEDPAILAPAVQQITAVIWTPEVVAAAKDRITRLHPAPKTDPPSEPPVEATPIDARPTP